MQVMESSQKEEEGLMMGVEISSSSSKKCCSDCKTTKTPLWRSGPSGPKSLCNACGIRYRKKRPSSSSSPAAGGGGKDDVKKKKKGEIGKTTRRGLKVREAALLLGKRERRRLMQWGEVERAALLLMALSCGAVFA